MMQTFNGDALVQLIKALVRLDAHWIPDKEGYSLYIRPAMSMWLCLPLDKLLIHVFHISWN